MLPIFLIITLADETVDESEILSVDALNRRLNRDLDLTLPVDSAGGRAGLDDDGVRGGEVDSPDVSAALRSPLVLLTEFIVKARLSLPLRPPVRAT
jgi:hypothetical protein